MGLSGGTLRERPQGGLLETLRLYAETLRHVRPVQVYGRLLAPVRRRLARYRLPDEIPEGAAGDLDFPSPPHHDPWNERSSILEGHFTFLNREAELGWPPEWHPADRSLLWRFTLHYHQFLYLLGPDERRHLCYHWIDRNPPGSDPGWHPYPLSRRIATWVRLGPEDPKVRESLYDQAAYLYRTVEWHQPGNHLLENARALALAGAFFVGTERGGRWWERAMRILREELPRQVLPDGGHMERSPAYHALMLEGITDVIASADASERSLLSDKKRERLVRLLGKMCDFLAAGTHPDGGLALLNDSTLEVAPPTDPLLGYAERVTGETPSGRREFPETGCFVHRDEDAYLIVDGGPVGPEYLPAHSHADVFTYELSLGETRFVVDTGVYEYRAGPRRDYARSTRAHNTVTVDGVDQAECWDSFRVARRFPPEDVDFRTVDGTSTFTGRFSGYAELIGDGIVHLRKLEADGSRKTITVRDRVTGRGEHEVISRVRLHPDAAIEHRSDAEVRVRRGEHELIVRSATHPLREEEGRYYPEFGREEVVTVLALGGREELPAEIRYELSY